MKRRQFGQHCGLARALELVGERWALLIVRDLLVRPRRYTDLQHALPGRPTNVLSARLKELERAGIVERQIAPAPQRGVLYTLTDTGRELEPAILALGRWGAAQLGKPRPGDTVTAESLTMTLRTVFDAEAAIGVTASWEIRLPDMVLHAVVANGALADIGPGPSDADLVITVPTNDQLPSYGNLMRTIGCGLAELTGQAALADVFVRLFGKPPGI
ncbi:helix-turn-helix domain-containing protein [Kutzneria sp. 744]|uniref:winged helix-turn-helix transcriptional regulator n=1 Tax=Kutzneria sp. (strain 744) TaxID=345341 RepID=UPI0003EEAFD7|nr:helix-turn-helix domain-containing protein [Kutzneria sp. 744]EWM18692.1 transcriptional regulator, HxlR family [Kutzneria sp. 744]